MVNDPDLRVVREPAACSSAPPPALGERSDEELMAASAAGHRDAFEVLVARYLPRLTSYCAKLTRDAGAAEDLAQDTLLALWHRRAGYRPERALRVLVFTIALNRCRNHARSWRRRLRWLGLARRVPLFVLAFAVDARGEVHWLYPGYATGADDPAALPLPVSNATRLMADSVVLDGVAAGALRVIVVVSAEPLHVSAIERLHGDELAATALQRRFASAAVSELLLEVAP